MDLLKTKVLYILHLPPPVHGAAMVGQCIKESEKINSTFIGRYLNLSTSSSVEEIGKGGFRKILRYCNLLYQSVKLALFFRPKIVYVTVAAKGGGFYKDAILVLLLKFLRQKIVIHFHNKGVNDNRKKKLNNILYKLVFKKSKVILLSSLLKEDIKHYVHPKNIYICPNGIQGIDDHFNDKEKTNVIPHILFVGNLVESKGVYDLLSALKAINANNVLFTCTIIGDEGTISKAQIEQLILEYNLSDKVRYKGKQIGEIKNNIYKSADLLVLPSHDECFPLVILEGMSIGLPVISTNVGGIPEIVSHENTGLLVEKKNIPGLTEAISRLIHDENYRMKLGENGKTKFYKNFTKEIFEAQFVNVLEQIIHDSKHS